MLPHSSSLHREKERTLPVGEGWGEGKIKTATDPKNGGNTNRHFLIVIKNFINNLPHVINFY